MSCTVSWPDGSCHPFRQVVRPLLPKQPPSGGRPNDDGPAELRSFPAAEKLLGEDARFLRAPPRDRRGALRGS